MKTRVGIIGLGNIAEKAYLPILTGHSRTEIVGIVSNRQETVERVGGQYRIQHRFTRLKDLWKRAPEAVFIHSPTDTHYEIVTECLREGIHVYVDKPLSNNIKESVAMVETAERYGKLLCVGFNRRFAPMYVQAKEWMEEAGGFDQCLAQKHRTSRQRSGAKLTLYDDLIHIIDLLLWLGCGTHGISGYFQKDDEEGRLVHASGSLSWGSQSGFFSMNRQAGSDLERLELYGSGRSVSVVNMEEAIFTCSTSGERAARFGSWDSVLQRRGFTGVVEHFLNSLPDPEHCQIRGDQVLPSHFLIEKLSG
ncbi:Gfo/Idh/MocA family protein [Paenibacillus sp. J2TS4]|uniref:Gfo/Idh/MocA family protein n=1 Tax=Paenibacillus sp. J2TS4 TaxID=2807194 RepID=UPI001AFE1D44|nr:Gfo/Idh/MocA family oxidoreductase [Paenibacillus sp. J2TS4]GIP34430.1 hypothetical protein J2TS4_36400 [Paenibacillus sp. J2TS4]